jgi:hypothetical protein
MRKVTGATQKKNISPASKKTTVEAETGSPIQKSTKKVTREKQKKKNSLAQVSQRIEESEDSGDGHESSTSSSVAQKHES